MVQQKTVGSLLVRALIYLVLTLLALLCILPIINVVAISFSSTAAIGQMKVTFWPVDFTFKAYQFVISSNNFMLSMWISVQRVALGTVINMAMTVLIAYPLSKEVSQLRLRTFYAWIFVFTTLFSGGLVPTYLVVKSLGLMDTIWALVLPGAIPVFNVILLLNFIRSLPKELFEAGYIDGASHWKTLWSIVIPLSLPALATVTLFVVVNHWNEWFNGILYMNDPKHYPLASYLQTIIVRHDLGEITDPVQLKLYASLSDRAVRSAQIFLGALPIFFLYPFLQRYFMTGIVLGSVKE